MGAAGVLAGATGLGGTAAATAGDAGCGGVGCDADWGGTGRGGMGVGAAAVGEFFSGSSMPSTSGNDGLGGGAVGSSPAKRKSDIDDLTKFARRNHARIDAKNGTKMLSRNRAAKQIGERDSARPENESNE